VGVGVATEGRFFEGARVLAFSMGTLVFLIGAELAEALIAGVVEDEREGSIMGEVLIVGVVEDVIEVDGDTDADKELEGEMLGQMNGFVQTRKSPEKAQLIVLELSQPPTSTATRVIISGVAEKELQLMTPFPHAPPDDPVKNTLALAHGYVRAGLPSSSTGEPPVVPWQGVMVAVTALETFMR